jgi:hypothetical protein
MPKRKQPDCRIVDDGADLFVGMRIAKRGQPGTARAKVWVSLETGWEVFEDRHGSLVVRRSETEELPQCDPGSEPVNLRRLLALYRTLCPPSVGFKQWLRTDQGRAAFRACAEPRGRVIDFPLRPRQED